ncbi:MAG: redoxin domain-containing protein [Halioglobus sp.]
MKLGKFFALVLVFGLSSLATAETLQVGQQAPAFSLQGSDGNTYSLADYVGKQAVVLAWFPKAFTGGCTIECKSLAENGHLIREFDVAYFMASTDPLDKTIAFAESLEADFPLLSDASTETANDYGVLVSGIARRHTIYIGSDGKILKVDSQVTPASSAEDMVATLAELGIPKR